MTNLADTDADLIDRSARGQPDAFVAVVERHEVAVHGFLARRAGGQVADDLLAEVWLRAFSGRAGYDTSRDDARPWLYGIARNVLRAHWRVTARQRRVVADGLPDDPWDEVIDRLDSAAGARALEPALRALPSAELEVLLLVAWEQLTPAEVAVVTGVPQGTVRSRLHRARAALRLSLVGTATECEEGT
jgi:RNA polymerase sigma factor (sigma-70 family)